MRFKHKPNTTYFWSLMIIILAGSASAEPRCWYDGPVMKCAPAPGREWRDEWRDHHRWMRREEEHYDRWEWCYEHPGRC